ncbi:hypothetical protein GGE17_005744 [Rhizobium leguminosarum]|jgi:hypothetical protein|nr:hypothetical protein [Rhizobium leguminosarum]MBB5258860.1 hypothetical protein [Rhizobium leguminosarum]
MQTIFLYLPVKYSQYEFENTTKELVSTGNALQILAPKGRNNYIVL